MNVAILGVGTVGEQVVKFLKQNKDLIAARAGEQIIPVVGVVRDLSKKRDVDIELTTNMQEVLDRDDIDVFVELMGGVDEPFRVLSKILEQKKPVVTANKALLAYHRYALQSIAKDTAFGFEASVAGGIPIIKTLKEGLSANHICSIKGIVNGTSNFILSSMTKDYTNFEQALQKATQLGYAEADPSFDVDGFDAAHKLLILASIAYGVHGNPEDILIEGIRRINQEDMFFAKDFDYVIKLLAIAKRIKDKVELRVHPTLVPKDVMIAKISGVMNAVSVVGDAVGETMFYGPGAGGAATASAVISDLIDISRKVNATMLGYKSPLEPLTLLNQDDIVTKYYLRLKVDDKRGVLAKITNLMSENNLSIDSFLQKPRAKGDESGVSTLFFTTHRSLEADMKRVIKLLVSNSFVKEEPFMMRIED